MNKTIIAVIAIVLLVLAAMGYQHYQTNQFYEAFKSELQKLPAELTDSEVNTNLDEFKIDVMLIYPTLTIYYDFLTLKDKTFPVELEKGILEDDTLCKDFYADFRDVYAEGNLSKYKQILKFIKEDGFTTHIKYRNRFGEVMHEQKLVLSECPEYLRDST